MRKFWGVAKNENFSVGCTGKTFFVYDSNGKEIAKFSDFPHTYKAVFMPNKNIIAVKSTEGSLGFYNLDTLSLIKLVTVTNSAFTKRRISQKPKRFLQTMKKSCLTVLSLTKRACAMY